MLILELEVFLQPQKTLEKLINKTFEELYFISKEILYLRNFH